MNACDYLEPVLNDIRDRWDTEVYAIKDGNVWFVCLADVNLYLSDEFRDWLNEYRPKVKSKIPFSVVFCGKNIVSFNALEKLSSEERLVI